MYPGVHPDTHTRVLLRLIAAGHLFARAREWTWCRSLVSWQSPGSMLDLQSHANEFTVAFKNDAGFLEGVANGNEILRGGSPPCMFKMF